jgi:hypothetical protein
MADEHQAIESESTQPVAAEPPKETAELTAEELDKVSGGVASCATGKHIKEATLTS